MIFKKKLKYRLIRVSLFWRWSGYYVSNAFKLRKKTLFDHANFIVSHFTFSCVKKLFFVTKVTARRHK